MHRVSKAVVAALSLSPAFALAAWPSTPQEDVVVTRVSATQLNAFVPDGDGGFLVSWHDARLGAVAQDDIFAEHLTADGELLWNEATDGGFRGRAMVGGNGDQNFSQLVSDGAGGFYLGHREGTASIRVNRFDAAGVLVPGFNPVTVSGGSFVLLADGAGGVFLAASTTNAGSVTRFDSSGAPSAGPTLFTTSSDIRSIGMVLDGQGGVLTRYQQGTGGLLYVSRFSANLTPIFALVRTNAGVSTAFPEQAHCADSEGGAWVAFDPGSTNDIRLQHVLADAGYAFRVADGGSAAEPLSLASVAGGKDLVGIAADGTGGAIISWLDSRSGQQLYYAQRVDRFGAPQWGPLGLVLTTSAVSNRASAPPVVAGESVLLSWMTENSATTRAQRMFLDAGRAFPFGGVLVSAPVGAGFFYPQVLRPLLLADGTSLFATSYYPSSGCCAAVVHVKRLRPDGTLGDPDAGSADAGAGDAGAADGGGVDGGGVLDGGAGADAGVDAGAGLDAGAVVDAGAGTDGGGTDAGASSADAGTTARPDAGTGKPEEGGCGCSSVGASPMLLALLMLRRRRATQR